jgi:hypothetical protein
VYSESTLFEKVKQTRPTCQIFERRRVSTSILCEQSDPCQGVVKMVLLLWEWCEWNGECEN